MNRQELARRLEPLLAKVEKPGRYIGGEIGMVKKDPDRIPVRIAFAFPDTYELGMSYVGLQLLYDVVNQREDLYCERVFAPAPDMEALLREEKIPLFTLETKSPLKEFDLLGFTLQYEMSYTNILNMMDLAGIPLLASQRGPEDPIIIAGGPCAYNPEPLADFFDLFLIGDGEEVLPNLVELRGQFHDKDTFLRQAAQMEAVYVPSFYQVSYHEDGRIKAYEPIEKLAPRRVRRALIPDLDSLYHPRKPMIPLIEVAQRRAVVEAFRGCTRGCRFCQAGMIYRPVRERSAATIAEIADEQLSFTGHEELSLLSLSTSDHSQFEPMALSLMELCQSYDASLSLPSLRLDSVSREVMERMQEYRKSGLTFAPEAGTQRLRDVINKNITDEEIDEAVRQAVRLGWKKVKLYFMMGLPEETEEDLIGIGSIARRLMEINFEEMGRAGGRFQINISVANFVPKPHTPFQWEGQDQDFYDKHNLLKRHLKIKGVKYNYHDSPVSTLEALFARGDRRTGDLLMAAWHRGCKMDAWSEHFSWERWSQDIEDWGRDPGFYTTRKRESEEVFPWDIIDSGISKEFLWRERERARQGITTPDCRQGCQGCGLHRWDVCHVAKGEAAKPKEITNPLQATGADSHDDRHRYILSFSKKGIIRYTSHLDVLRLFQQSFKRAGIGLAYSQGYNPHPKISVASPLPLGYTSEGEWMDFETKRGYTPEEIMEKLNLVLPAGIQVIQCQASEEEKKGLAARLVAARYEIRLPATMDDILYTDVMANELIGKFLSQENITAMKREKKSGQMKPVNIRHRIRRMEILTKNDKKFLLTELDAGSQSNLSPDLLLTALMDWCGRDYERGSVEISRQSMIFK